MTAVLTQLHVAPPVVQRKGKRAGLWPFLALIGGLAALPLFLAPYSLVLMVPVIAFGIALLGMNLLFGYTGMLSFGHSIFLAVGAYAAAVATSKMGVVHLELVLLLACAAGAVLALAVGALCVRYTHIFFGMLTLAFGMLCHSFLFKFYNLTGGDQGMRVLRPSLLGISWEGGATSFLSGPFYYYCLALYIGLGLVMWRVVQSPFGLHLKAIRENEVKASYVGVRVYRMRLCAFVISGVYGSVAGALMAVTTGLADPEITYWTQSGNLIFMMVLGGSGSFSGPAIGALLFALLHDALVTTTEYWRFLLGAILVSIVIFMPQGVVGTVANVYARMKQRGSA